MTVTPTLEVMEAKPVEATPPPPAAHKTVSTRPSLRFGAKDAALVDGLNKAFTHHGGGKEAWLIKKYLLRGLQAAGFAPAS